jgi:hypothetical protein
MTMKKLILPFVFFVGVLTLGFSQSVKSVSDSVTLANGKRVSSAELDLFFKKAWDDSFGKMTDEDKKLLNGVNIKVTTPIEEEVIEPDTIIVEPIKKSI